MTRDELFAEAEVLAGRPVEVEETTGGAYVVLWMAFGQSPPKPGATEQEALENFIAYLSAHPPSAVVLPPVDS